MTTKTISRLALLLLAGGAFGALGWLLVESAPTSSRERPPPPTPLVDVVDSQPRSYPLKLEASGPVVSAFELEVRPQVGGRIVALHPDFEPGGRIPAGETVLQIETDDYRLAVESAEAEIAKARAAIALEQGRRVVAREELATLQGSIEIDPTSRALALRTPQLRQVEAELAAAQHRLARARLDLERTRVALPFDVVVLARERVAGEVVGARELIGRVTRADELWVELRTRPAVLPRLRARDATAPGSKVWIRDGEREHVGELVRIRAELAEDSRLAGVIAAVPADHADGQPGTLLLGQYVEAEIDAGRLDDVIELPRRAIRDNRRVWVVDADGRLQVRDAKVLWRSGQKVMLDPQSLAGGDRVVVSRVSGLVPGTGVRARTIDPDSGRVAIPAEVAGK
jgi:RND family efflux transporter MFP subunit